jgi:two-component system NtrC family sensor kinase
MADPAVLVVDDEPGITRLCQRLLERANFSVKAVTDAEKAINFLAQQVVDLLLVDIRMPAIDGFRLIELARKRQPDLAVVVMTGFGTVETAIEALHRDADGLILKPFTGAELVQSVRHALQDSQHKQDVLRLQTLRPLFNITESLFTETNPERLLGLLLDMAIGHLHCTQAGFYQRSPAELVYRLSAGRGGLPVEENPESEASLPGLVVRWGAPLCVNREGPGDEQLQAVLVERGLSSVLGAPVEIKEGDSVLLAARSFGEPAFRESDLEMFAILARQAGVALENARLHAELRAYIRQVEDSQRALIQAEKMTIAGRLTASIAHEINNPLQSVSNCLHLASRSELSLQERQDYLEMAQNEMDRLMNTVQRMLDFYRPGVLDSKPVDLNELVQKVITLTSGQLEEHRVHVSTRFSSKLVPVLAVGDQLQQVLLNLVLNAMEAMPEGGRLFIETAARKNNAEITIEDTGPGVAESQREHIFEPFVSTKEGGTGLGLAVSYGILSAHGGSLELVEGRGRGACFKIILPSGSPS